MSFTQSCGLTAEEYDLLIKLLASSETGHGLCLRYIVEETEKPYDWAIILGGTNDLTLSRGAKDIWEGLKKVYDFPLSNNTKVLALTVMENCCGVPPTRRNKLNKAILEYEAENL
jgi:hypothetical protein